MLGMVSSIWNAQISTKIPWEKIPSKFLDSTRHQLVVLKASEIFGVSIQVKVEHNISWFPKLENQF